jgi:glutaredoxin 3
MKKPVIVYTSKGCSYCEQVINFFENQKIEVVEKNVSESEKNFLEWKAINPMGTPLTCYEDHVVIGLHKKNLGAIVKEIVGRDV